MLTVEAFRSAPVRLRFGARVRRLAILGLEPGGRLFRPLAAAVPRVELPADGLVLWRKLAEVLGCRRGDELQVEVLEGARPVRRIVVSDVVVAIPLGWLLGYLFAAFLTSSLDTEVHRFPLLVRRETYLFATAVTLTASFLSALIVGRQLDRLDLVSVLKSRD